MYIWYITITDGRLGEHFYIAGINCFRSTFSLSLLNGGKTGNGNKGQIKEKEKDAIRRC